MYDKKKGCQKMTSCYQGDEFACMKFERIENGHHKIIQSCKKADACYIQQRSFKNQMNCKNGNCIRIQCCFGDYCNGA